MRISDWSSDVCSSDLLLHALAHIELNAIDLAADIVARFTAEALPRGFYDDWLTVADEEGKHYLLLADRLAALGFAYGDLPAPDGLWQAAPATAHDLLARPPRGPLVPAAPGPLGSAAGRQRGAQ